MFRELCMTFQSILVFSNVTTWGQRAQRRNCSKQFLWIVFHTYAPRMHGYVLSHRNDTRDSDTNAFANREVGGGFNGFHMLRCMLHEMQGEGVMNEITQKRTFFCMHPFVTFGKGSRFDQVCSFSMFLSGKLGTLLVSKKSRNLICWLPLGCRKLIGYGKGQWRAKDAIEKRKLSCMGRGWEPERLENSSKSLHSAPLCVHQKRVGPSCL